jgi:hypothetical protein
MPVYRVYKAYNGYNVADVAALDYAQAADVIYLAHNYYAPGKLTRLTHTDWVFSNVTFAPTITAPTGVSGTATTPNTDSANSGNAYFPEPATYVVTAYNSTTGQESVSSFSVTLTNDLTLKRNYNTISWGAVTGATQYRVYKATQTGSYGLIITTRDATQLSAVDDNVGPDYSSGPPVGYNPFATANDYPGCVRFHEQRSWWARTINTPNAIYGSRSADFENMDYSSPGREDDSLAIALVSDKVNTINQLVSSKTGLLALTSNNLFSIQGSSDNYITATPPPKATPQVNRGSSALRPISVDQIIFYQTVKTGQVRTIGYEFQIDGLRTDDVTIFSRHLFETYSIIDWAWCEKPHSAVVGIRDDGNAVVLTWDEAQQVWGWTIWTTSGLYKGVCAITEQGEDRVYFLVQRSIDGVAVTYVERMASEFWTDQKDACYLDCAKTYAFTSPETLCDKLDHLEGQTVYAWVDGALVDKDSGGNPLVVTNGQITLPYSGSTVTVGIPFTAEIETLPLAVETRAGWTIAKPQDGGHAVIKVVNSRNIVAGPNADNAFEIKQRQNETYGEPTQLFTGNLHTDLAAVSGEETTIYIRSDVPAPMEIVGVMVEPNIADLS